MFNDVVKIIQNLDLSFILMIHHYIHLELIII